MKIKELKDSDILWRSNVVESHDDCASSHQEEVEMLRKLMYLLDFYDVDDLDDLSYRLRVYDAQL